MDRPKKYRRRYIHEHEPRVKHKYYEINERYSDLYESSETSKSWYESDNIKFYCSYPENIDFKKY